MQKPGYGPAGIARFAALVGVLALGVAGGGARAAVEYVEVTDFCGIQPYIVAAGTGAGVAAADFDADGLIDLFVPNESGVADQLYRNLGNGQFEEIAAAAGVASLDRSRVALWLDFDGDDLLDLFVAGDCFQQNVPACTDFSTLRLYRQITPLVFQDVTLAAGITDDKVFDGTEHRSGVSAGDLNNDGWLDLVFGLWNGEARLFVNDGDGTFTEAVNAGLGDSIQPHYQPLLLDFDGDGWMDIYYTHDFIANRLWINQADGTFVDQAAAAGADNAMNDMGGTLGDYDNDGDFDIYITNIDNQSTRHNVLLRNDSAEGLSFADVASLAGVDNGGWGWGTTFLDANNDGWLDIAETNGWDAGGYVSDRSRLFIHDGADPPGYEDDRSAGFDDTFWGSSLVALDYDRDGDLDLAQTCNVNGAQPSTMRMLENRVRDVPAGHNYLVIRPRTDGPNRRAIGAVVRVTAGSLQMTRLIMAGTSFLGQEPAEAFFGLGSEAVAQLVTVDWPDGSVTQLTDVAANQVLTVQSLLDTDGDGTPDSTDPDDDDDGQVDGMDCAPRDATVWQAPGPVSLLTLTHSGGPAGPTTLSWGPPLLPGGSSVLYDTIASPQAGDFLGPASCVESDDGTDTTAVDTTALGAGQILFFLPRAGNACDEGSVGADAGGTPRAARGCP